MNDVLREVFERAQQQPEPVQRHIAELVRRELELAQQEAAAPLEARGNYAGAWNDLPEDDELEALDRMRHESSPTPPLQTQLDWLKDA
jgi:hypothetical protein